MTEVKTEWNGDAHYTDTINTVLDPYFSFADPAALHVLLRIIVGVSINMATYSTDDRVDDTCTEENQKAKKRRTTYYCGHCETQVSKSTYYRHKSQYYNEFNHTWNSSSKWLIFMY